MKEEGRGEKEGGERKREGRERGRGEKEGGERKEGRIHRKERSDSDNVAMSTTFRTGRCVAMPTDPPVLSFCLNLLYSSTMYSALSLLI